MYGFLYRKSKHCLTWDSISALISYHNLQLLQGSDVGDCTMDTFSVTAPGNVGSPVICGYNTGQHSETLEKYSSYFGSHDLSFLYLTFFYLYLTILACRDSKCCMSKQRQSSRFVDDRVDIAWITMTQQLFTRWSTRNRLYCFSSCMSLPPFLSDHGRQRPLPQGHLRPGQHLNPALVGHLGDAVRLRWHPGRP